MCYALSMCHTITNSEQFSIMDPWAVKMCLYVRDFLIFISTDVKLKPRQNEFISTQIFYLNKYNKIFCVCTCVRHTWARKLNGKIFVCATENTNCEQIDIISYIKAINTLVCKRVQNVLSISSHIPVCLFLLSSLCSLYIKYLHTHTVYLFVLVIQRFDNDSDNDDDQQWFLWFQMKINCWICMSFI